MSMHCIHEYFAHVITGTIIDTCDTCTVEKGAPHPPHLFNGIEND